MIFFLVILSAGCVKVKDGKGLYEGMIYIPAGKFRMGSNTGHGDEQPIHTVYLDAYYIDKYEVTFGQYIEFCKATGREVPSNKGWESLNRPVINVFWYDAVAYAEWVGKRLPTEAEWEKACRAGSNTMFSFGNIELQMQFASDHEKIKFSKYAWYGYNSKGKTRLVGQKKPNKWGIYDMHGNVAEWCSDWYSSDYYEDSPYKNPTGPDYSRSQKIVRGGSWGDYAYDCRSANRMAYSPYFRNDCLGFRCVVSAPHRKR